MSRTTLTRCALGGLLLLLTLACTDRNGSATVDETAGADSEVVELGETGSGADGDVDGLTLSDEHADELRSLLQGNAEEVPDGMSESLLAIDKRPAMVHEDASEDGEGLVGLLTVANVYAVPWRGQVVCVRDWAQVPCSPERDTVGVDLPPWSASQHEFAFEEAEDSVVFAMLFLEDDRRATDSTSMSHLITQPQDWDDSTWPAVSAEEYATDTSFPSCGFAVFHDGRDIGEGYQPPDVVDRQSEVSMIVEACEDYEPVWMVPVLVRNRVEVVDADWVGRPVLLDRSVELPIPASVIDDPDTVSLQFVWYIRENGELLSKHTPEVTVE